MSTSPEILLDGAHNIAAAQALARYLRRFYNGRRIWIVFGVMRDKAVDEIAALLFPLAHQVILTRPANSRSMPPEMIAVPGAILTHSVSEALLAARQAAAPGDLVLITGSLYVVGEARAFLVDAS